MRRSKEHPKLGRRTNPEPDDFFHSSAQLEDFRRQHAARTVNLRTSFACFVAIDEAQLCGSSLQYTLGQLKKQKGQIFDIFVPYLYYTVASHGSIPYWIRLNQNIDYKKI
jgi:hypothetical protein